SFNLNELPFVLGLFLCDPRMVVLARVLAACVVLTLVQRQTILKLVFNICLAALESVFVVAMFVVFRPVTGDGPGAWAVAVAGPAGFLFFSSGWRSGRGSPSGGPARSHGKFCRRASSLPSQPPRQRVSQSRPSPCSTFTVARARQFPPSSRWSCSRRTGRMP